MNIKISKEEHEFLLKYKTHGQVVGSHLYGCNTPDSDKDILLFYEIPEWERERCMSIYPNISQFQYTDQEHKIDYIWTTMTQFLKNLASGDSTINADAILFGNPFRAATLTDEQRLRYVRTYKIIKAYLGFGKRDLKQCAEGEHKLMHAFRCNYTASCLMNNRIPSLSLIRDIYTEKQRINRPGVAHALEVLREKLNKMYENKELEMYHIHRMDGFHGPLFQKLIDSNNIREFKY